jgi:hypothetical protein
MTRTPQPERRWRAEYDLGYSLAVGLAGCVLVFAVGCLATALPASWLCLDGPGCASGERTLLSHFFVWDTGWYDAVARAGYPVEADGRPAPAIAFMPLWPIILRLLKVLATDPVTLHAVTVLVAGCIAVLSVGVFHALARSVLDPPTARRATLLYVTFPAMHFLLQSYPVGLLNLLCELSLLAVLRRRFLLAALWSGIATAAGPIAVSAAAAVGAAALVDAWLRLKTGGAWRDLATLELARLLGIAALAVGGLLAFMIWQAVVLGTPFAFLHAQQEWGQAPIWTARAVEWLRCELIYHDFVMAIEHGGFAFDVRYAGRAQSQFQYALNAFGLGVALLGLAGVVRRPTWPILLQSWLAIALFVWFIATIHPPDCALRLAYMAPGCFIGMAWLTRRMPLVTYGIATLSGVILLIQTTLSGAGYWVV